MTGAVRGRDGARIVPEEFVLFDEVMRAVDEIVAEFAEFDAAVEVVR